MFGLLCHLIYSIEGIYQSFGIYEVIIQFTKVRLFLDSVL